MRAVVCRELAGIDGLALVEDWPEPAAGTGEVLLDVRAAALNFPDLLMVQGRYQDRPPLPFVAGSELSGVIAAVGEGVGGFQPGDRVVAACGGALATRVAVKASQLLTAPRALDDRAAAGICITYFTSMHALMQRARLQAGETLLVLGAAGGVGTTAVQLGKLLGATVIAAAGSARKLEHARSLGADHLVDYSTQDLRERIKQLTGGRGVDVVYDPVGGTLAEPVLRSMAWGGRYLVIGFAGGPIPSIPLNLPLLKGCSIVGVYWGSFAVREPEVQGRNVAALWEHFETGRLAPVIGEVHPLQDFRAAFEALEQRRAMGKVVVTVAG
ncbi:MAG TPA: NADPH:quinone oxidoreductase family protein [Steroidobacteraceae bacterium]